MAATRDQNGEVTSEAVTGLAGPASTSYTYDSLSRVSSEGPTGYAYNSSGQLSSGPGGNTQAFDPAGQLCWSAASAASGASCAAPPSGATSYTFDPQGDRTQAASPSGTSTFGFDQALQLTSATTPSGSANYTYDASGLLAARSVGTGATSLVWDPVSSSVAQVVYDGANYYIYGPDGLALEQVAASSGATYYYLHDQVGSTRALTDSSGKLIATWSYDAWGNTVATSGATSLTALLYAGQYQDPTTGLYYMRARWYDPGTGQFLSVDPALAQTLDAYGYADEDPVNGTDPSGLFCLGSICLGFHPLQSLEGLVNFTAGLADAATSLVGYSVPVPFASNPELRWSYEIGGLTGVTEELLATGGAASSFTAPLTLAGVFGSATAAATELGAEEMTGDGPLVGLAEGAIEAEAELSPAAQAAGWQGQGAYPGVDAWENVTLKAGTKVYAGEPGVSGFFASSDAAASVGNDATALNEGLQIAPRAGVYRPGLTEFTLTQDVEVARSIALANPQFGAGGLEQYYIPNWADVTEPVQSTIMQNRVAP